MYVDQPKVTTTQIKLGSFYNISTVKVNDYPHTNVNMTSCSWSIIPVMARIALLWRTSSAHFNRICNSVPVCYTGNASSTGHQLVPNHWRHQSKSINNSTHCIMCIYWMWFTIPLAPIAPNDFHGSPAARRDRPRSRCPTNTTTWHMIKVSIRQWQVVRLLLLQARTKISEQE